LFFQNIVQNILNDFYPDLKYSACLIGPGSEILGYDDYIPKDHDWGRRLQILLKNSKYKKFKVKLFKKFQTDLPYEFKVYSTNWMNNLQDSTQ